MNLFTQQNFTVVRQIPDHTDATTYYVQAKIRNAYTDVLLATLNLEDKTGQRFKKDWRVPADPSGEGFYVSIITSVYTDSGYTTKSPLYGDDENTYLVVDRKVVGGGGGGGGYGGPSVRDIKDAVKEIVDSRKPKPFKIPEVKIPKQKEYEMKWDDVLEGITKLSEAVSKLPQKQTELDPIIKMLSEMNHGVTKIQENMPELDLSPVLDQLKEYRTEKEAQHGEMTSRHEDLTNNLPSILEKVVSKVIKETNFVTSFITSVHQAGKKEQAEEEPAKQINIKNLSS